MGTKVKIMAMLSILVILLISLMATALYNDWRTKQAEINANTNKNEISYENNTTSNNPIMKLKFEETETGSKIADLTLIEKQRPDSNVHLNEITPAQTSIRMIANKPMITMKMPESVQNGESFTVDFIIDPIGNQVAGIETNVFMKNIKAENVDLINSEEFSMHGEINAENIRNIVLTNKNGFSGRFMTVKFIAIMSGKANIEIRATVVDDSYATSEIMTSEDLEIKG